MKLFKSRIENDYLHEEMLDTDLHFDVVDGKLVCQILIDGFSEDGECSVYHSSFRSIVLRFIDDIIVDGGVVCDYSYEDNVVAIKELEEMLYLLKRMMPGEKMNPIDRDIKMLEECSLDRKSMQNARTIVLTRAKKHHSGLIGLAGHCGQTHDLYEGIMTDAARVRLAVSRFIRRYRQAV